MRIEIPNSHVAVFLIMGLVIAGMGTVIAQGPKNPGHPISQVWADSDLDMEGHKITNAGVPQNDNDVATKGYSDFGDWDSSYDVNTVYQAQTDGFVVVDMYYTSGTLNTDDGIHIEGYTDSSSPPTTKRVDCYVWMYSGYDSCIMPVKQGDYWKMERMYQKGNFYANVQWLSAKG